MSAVAGLREGEDASGLEPVIVTAPPGLPRSPMFLAGAAMFALALLVMPTAPGMGDSAEFVLALALAGIPHPTGYPLYTLLGHAFVVPLHALGLSWVVASILWSALGAAVAIGALTRVVQHVVATIDEQDAREGRSPVDALARSVAIALPVAAFALHPVWIQAATITEVYTWNVALIALASAFALGRLRAIPSPARWSVAADLRDAACWGFLCGLCGAHHATSALFVLPLSAALIAAWVKAGRWRASLAIVAVAAALIPLASYLWISWRAAHPAAFQWPVGASPRALWMHMRASAYRYYLGHWAPAYREWWLIRWTLLPAVLPGLMLGALLVRRVAARPARWGLMALLLGAALQIAFIAKYGVPDPSMYFLPPLMVALLVPAPVLLGIARMTSSRVAVLLGGGIALVCLALTLPHAFAERRRLARVDADFRMAWASIPFDRGIVLWRDDHYQRFKMLQILEGQRTHLYVESPDMLIWPARRRAFTRELGFDPLAGVNLDTPDDIARIPTAIRRKTRMPMLLLPEYREPPRPQR
jgi:hypothetical protein